jgi:hypothetical protein
MSIAEQRMLPNAATRKRVRLLFLSALIVMAAQTVYKKVADEPYPGIFQPTFASTPPDPSSVEVFEPQLVARYEDGRTQSFTAKQVFYDASVLPSRVFRAAFDTHADSLDSPAVMSWLHDRLTQIGPGASVDEATINWRTATYPMDRGAEPTFATTKTRVVDFGEQE